MRTIELSNHLVQTLAHARSSGADIRAHASVDGGHGRQSQASRLWLGRMPPRLCATLRSWLAGATPARKASSLRAPQALQAAQVGMRLLVAQDRRPSAGARAVSSALGDVLDDRWVLLHRYRNRRGGIDALLLGPAGLFAIEAKHRDATIECDGDAWCFRSDDRHRNTGECGPLADRRGRSPARQLNEPADALEAFLADSRQPLKITRIVVLTHPRSKLGRIARPTVHVTTDPRRVLTLIAESPPVIPERRLAQIERLIVRDHDRHERERGPKRDRRASPTTPSHGT